jgi:predicted transposase/invertase (TIGR01784 family)
MILTDTQSAKAALSPLSPKDDFVFHLLFGDQNHVDMIVAFLKSFVELPDDEYTELTIVNPKLLPAVRDGKTCVLDLRLRTRTGNAIHVEIQRSDTREMAERITVYGGRLFGEQVKSGEDYRSVNRVISVLIVDFFMLKERADYHTRFLLRSDDGLVVLTDKLEFHILELRKIPAAEDGRKLWRWLKFLSAATEEEFTMLHNTYAELQKPVARLMEMSADEVLRYRKDSWDKARWDEAARMRLAKAEGRDEGKAEVAVNMRRKGLPVDMIAEMTGLTPEEIADLPEA